MKKVLISGYYGFDNTGDEAILEVLTQELSKSGMDVSVFSNCPSKTQKNYPVKAYKRFDMMQILKAISSCDFLISGGGSLFQDVTSSSSLYYYLAIVKIAQMLRKKVFIYSQGIGPINHEANRKRFAKIIAKTRSISVRDEISKDELMALGVDEKLPAEVTADPVFILEPAAEERARQILSQAGVDLQSTKLRIGMALRHWGNQENSAAKFAQIADQIISQFDAEVVFFPFHDPHDVNFSKEVMKQMQQKAHILEKSYLPSEIMAAMGLMNMNVGVRLHALIFSARMEVPMIGVSYDPKIDGFLKSMGLNSACTYKELNWDMIRNSIEHIQENYHAIQHSISQHRQKSSQLARNTFDRLMEEFGK